MSLNTPTASHRISQGFTRLDCAKRQVTGIRYDPIINQYEIWVFGTLKREVPAEGGRERVSTMPMRKYSVYLKGVFNCDSASDTAGWL